VLIQVCVICAEGMLGEQLPADGHRSSDAARFVSGNRCNASVHQYLGLVKSGNASFRGEVNLDKNLFAPLIIYQDPNIHLFIYRNGRN